MRLKGFDHGPLAALYVMALPVLGTVVYILICTAPWRFDEHSVFWGIRLRFKGLLSLVLACLALVFLDRVGLRCFAPGVTPPENPLWDVTYSVMELLLVGFMVVLTDGLANSRDLGTRRAREAEAALLEAKTQLVVAQLDSHNVLNVMANVGTLLERDPKLAVLMVEAASFYLRRLLDCTKVPMISLWEERQIIEDYLSVETMRMNDRLQVQWDWPKAFDEVRLPPVLIQPMVENAVKHGLWPSPTGGMIRICAREDEGRLIISVHNTGEPLSRDTVADSSGLDTLRKRLHQEYGSAASFDLVADGPWTVASVTIPLASQPAPVLSTIHSSLD